MSTRRETQEGYLRVLDFLATGIKEHSFEPSGRLPTERELAEQFSVSRALTRRALSDLEARGLIRRRAGRGGTVLRTTGHAAAPSTQAPGPEATVSPVQYIESRLRFEPQFAWLVATNATAEDFERMEDCLKRGEKATTRDAFELWDSAFHQAVAAATHNTVAIRMYDIIHAVRHEQQLWHSDKQQSQTGEQRLVFQREHQEIFEALKSRNAERAYDLMMQHIRATLRRLFDF